MVDMKPLAMMIGLALTALALAACGSSGNNNRNGTGGSDEDKAFEGAVKYAQCMRRHGVQMSDPERGTNGGILMKAGGDKGPGSAPSKTNTADPDSPVFKAADRACGRYRVEPDNAHQPSPQEQAERNDALIGYARCMRGKGINFPDPRIDGNRVSQRLGPDANPNAPKFKAADRACHGIIAKVMPDAPGGSGPSSSGNVEVQP